MDSKYHKLLALVLPGLVLGCDPSPDITEEVGGITTQPNILLIMTDDMGYTNLGSFGSEIRTPNLDALALRGVRFTNFHAGPGL